ncbi:hypothetical protein [Pasteurella canis]|uniref:hypothetical protein n=1 Tax=Pasteurella canis TaxID=753 RepID=UPI001CD0C451
MWETWIDIKSSREKRSLRSWIHESQFDLSDVHNQYNVGLLNLDSVLGLNNLYLNIVMKSGSYLMKNSFSSYYY